MKMRAVWVIGAVALLAAAAIPAGLARWRPLQRERALRRAPDRPDVLLITLDTTRADKLGCYGGERGVSPALDQLARKGVLFRRAYSHVPVTLPSHASLLTGVLPARNGVHDNGTFVLDATFPTLAEQYARAGYRTGAFVSSVVLDRMYGLSRGFGDYVDEMEGDETEDVLTEVRASVTVDRALAWLRQGDARPVFAWVHFYDPHNPYQPPEPFAGRFKGKPYDGEIAYMDSEIGRLLQGLGERGRPNLVAAVADHGESLGEHQEPTHAFFIYAATQHVPLVLRYDGVLPAGREVAAVVGLSDLMPTLLEISRLQAPEGMDGHTLVPLITGRTDREPGPVYQESYVPRLSWGAAELLGVRTGPWLFIRAPRPELYNVEDDPAETLNLAAERPEELDRLRAALDRLAPGGDPLARQTEVDPEMARRLRALGYLGGLGEDAKGATRDLPDPKDVAPLLKEIAAAESFRNRREYDKALAAYEDLARRMPRSTMIAGRIAKMLLALERYDAAYDFYLKLIRENPAEEGFHIGMVRARFRQGHKAEALALTHKSLQAFPDSEALHENAGIILQDLGRLAEAEAEYRQAVHLSPRAQRPRLALASIRDTQGRLEEAASEYAAVLGLSPHSRQGRQSARRLATLAEGFGRKGNLEAARDAYAAALRSDQAAAEVYLNAGLISYRLGHREEALALVRRGVGRFPESADLQYRLGRLLSDRGTATEAEAAYVTALQLAPNRQDVRIQLARLLESTGRAPQATVLYRQVVDTAPASREAAGARQALQRLAPGGSH
jgi:arylsulfatase A-like enzyme/Flp pilus assembly protein TadD